MNILVTGANGQLGNEMRIVSKGCEDTFVFSDIIASKDTIQLDITDINAVRDTVSKYDIDAIVNCAAYTNVDAAEDNSELASRLNAEAPAKLAIVMSEVDGLLVHISTDYVFGGNPADKPLKETDAPCPTGVYGRTKLYGEHAIKSSGCEYVIIRTAWLYSEFGKNFCKTMLDLTANKPEIKVVNDQMGTPTYALDLAETILKVLENPVQGIYNFSNEGAITWFDFAKTIYEKAREIAPSRPECKVNPCTSTEFPSKVVRPAYSVLDKESIKAVYGVEIPAWEDSLEKCLKNLL